MANYDLGSSLSKQEHTVINIGDPDGVPRLVSRPRQPGRPRCWMLADFRCPDYLRAIVTGL
jgi:hypothetical protein